MELEKIKKDCRIITNEEKQGEELYFDSKPASDIIKVLKKNGYRWHNTKKCWYRKLNYTGTGAEKTNYLGVKIGDIFHYSWRLGANERKLFSSCGTKGNKTSCNS